MMQTITIGTRASPLSLSQTKLVVDFIEARTSCADVKVCEMTTMGDRCADLKNIGGKGAFVREIDHALIEGHIDLAVHSLKDIPGLLDPSLEVAAFLPRNDPFDCLITRENFSLDSLPLGAVVGTSSPRRCAQMSSLRSDLILKPIRGRVETRLEKLDRGDVDALLLARAGLNRLHIKRSSYSLEDVMIPAAGQGTVAVVVRKGDSVRKALVADLDCALTRAASLLERCVLEAYDGNCFTPLCAFAQPETQENVAFCMDIFMAREDLSVSQYRCFRGLRINTPTFDMIKEEVLSLKRGLEA